MAASSSSSSSFEMPALYEAEDSWGPPMTDETPFGFQPFVITKSWDRFTPRIIDVRDEREAEKERASFSMKRGDGFRAVEQQAKVEALSKQKDAQNVYISNTARHWGPEWEARVAARGGGPGAAAPGAAGAAGATAGAAAVGRGAASASRGGRGGRGGASRGGGRGGGGRGGRGGRGRGRGRGRFNSNSHRAPPGGGPVVSQDRDLLAPPLPFNQLTGVTGVGIPPAIDFDITGRTKGYDVAVDRATHLKPVPLTPAAKELDFARPPVSVDPIMRDKLKEVFKETNTTRPVLVTTDKCLAAVMASPTGNYMWDLRILGNNRFIFLEEVEDKEHFEHFSTEWVNENSAYVKSSLDQDSINHFKKVGEESTEINKSYKGSCHTKAMYMHPGSKRNPWQKDKSAPTMFRYRHFRALENTPQAFDVFIRCEIDAAIMVQGQQPQLVKAFALLEQLPDGENVASEWKSELATKGKGNLLMKEVPGNRFKICKWIAQSVLSGAQLMKIAFVTRANPGDNTKHVVLGVETKEPVSFASQFQIKIDNLWSIVGEMIKAYRSITPQPALDTPVVVVRDSSLGALTIAEPIAADGKKDDDDSSSGEDEEDEEDFEEEEAEEVEEVEEVEDDEE